MHPIWKKMIERQKPARKVMNFQALNLESVQECDRLTARVRLAQNVLVPIVNPHKVVNSANVPKSVSTGQMTEHVSDQDTGERPETVGHQPVFIIQANHSAATGA